MKRLPISWLVLWFGATAACSHGVRPRSGQNIVLLTVDTLRADHLSCYGYRGGQTPNIDRLAREGVRFEQVVAQVPVTLPSHASLLTGLAPPVHGVRDNTYFRLDPAAHTLAEHLKLQGYQTAAFVGAFVLDHSFGLDQGFDVYDDRIEAGAGATPGAVAERKAGRVAEAFTAWLGTVSKDKPFFAWLHFFDPHMPYDPPSPFRERFHSLPYDGEIAYVDEQIGVVLNALRRLGALDDTLLVLVSDHGESLGEHGERTHGFFVYDATLRVPLILRSPASLPAGKTVAEQVRTVDVVPTLLVLVAAPALEGIQGQSLVSQIDGRQAASLPAYSECYVPELNFHWAPLVALRKAGYKYIEAPRPELYDLRADPGETHNLVDELPERRRQMQEELEALLKRWPRSFSARRQPDAETLERLRSLGYVAGRSASGSPAEALPDPKDRLGLWDKAERVILQLSAGEYRSAEELAESIIHEDPSNLLAMELLANAYEKQGSLEKAVALHRRILSIDATRPLSHVVLANLLWKLGRLEEAERRLQKALELDARFAGAYERLGELKLERGEVGAAREQFTRALEIDATRRRARLGLARSLRAAGRMEAARAEYERLHRERPEDVSLTAETAALLAQMGQRAKAEQMLRGAPEHYRVHYALSVLLRAKGRMGEALSELDKTIALEPDFASAHHDRGVILSRMGRAEEALASLNKALALREDAATRNALGTALCRIGRCREAIHHFEKAVALAPNFVEALENLSEAYRLSGRMAEARAVRERLARLQR